MLITKLARVYAKALFDLAQERNELEAVRADMQLIRRTVDESRDLRAMLKSPVITSDRKNSVLEAIFGKVVKESTMLLTNLMVRRGREAKLAMTCAAFENMYLAFKGVQSVEITTAIALENGEEEEIKKKIAAALGKEVSLTASIKPEIIGGVIVRVHDREYNGSLASRLNALKREFDKNFYIKDF